MFTLTASLPVTVTLAVPMDATDSVARIRHAAAFVVAMSFLNPTGWTSDEYSDLVDAVCTREGASFARFGEQELAAQMGEFEYGRNLAYEWDNVEYGDTFPWAWNAADVLREMAR